MTPSALVPCIPNLGFLSRIQFRFGCAVDLPLRDYDALVVGLSDGMLVQETANTASTPITVAKGSVMLVPRNERTTLRNSSGHNVKLVVIENRQKRHLNR